MTHILNRIARAAACTALCTAAVAKPSDPSAPQPAFDLASPVQAALTQLDDDGTLWARGPAWKAHFIESAVEFRALPAAGQAPQQARFRLDSVTVGSARLALAPSVAPVLEAARVTYDRGGLTEVYDLLPGGIEQSFVFLDLPASGDLTIRIAVETALCGRELAEGLSFESDGRTSVRYGDMHILDASGRRLEQKSRLEGSDIVLRVPRAFLATATFPLVVDPIISAFAVDGGGDLCSKPDVAFDATTLRWLVVYERAAGDEGDIISRRYDINGVLLEELAVDISDDDTVTPSVGNNNTSNQFLIVWTKLPGILSLTQKIRGRTRSATSTAQGAIFNVTSTSANETHPRVGGSPTSGDSKYLVVWTTQLLYDFGDIHARTVSTGAALGPILDIQTDSDWSVTPAITKSCGPGGVWGIAYENVTDTNTPIRLAFVNKAGTLLATEIDADLSGIHGDGFLPKIAGDGRVFAATWSDDANFNQSALIGSFFAFQSGIVSGLAGTFDLSAVEPGAIPARGQKSGAIETDGIRFTYSYFEQRANSNDFDVFAATIDPITGVFSEGHVSLGASILQDTDLAMASTFGSASALPSRCFAAWTRQPAATNFDVIGALYLQP